MSKKLILYDHFVHQDEKDEIINHDEATDILT